MAAPASPENLHVQFAKYGGRLNVPLGPTVAPITVLRHRPTRFDPDNAALAKARLSVLVRSSRPTGVPHKDRQICTWSEKLRPRVSAPAHLVRLAFIARTAAEDTGDHE